MSRKVRFTEGVIAAPVFKEIAKQALSYLNVPREDVGEKNILVVEREMKAGIDEIEDAYKRYGDK